MGKGVPEVIEFPEFKQLVDSHVTEHLSRLGTQEAVARREELWSHKNAGASLALVPAGPHGDVAVLHFLDGRRSQALLVVERTETGALQAARRIVEDLTAWGDATS